MRLGKPKLRANFQVDGFIYYENIREFVFKSQIRLLIYPLGDLGVTADVTYSLLKSACSTSYSR